MRTAQLNGKAPSRNEMRVQFTLRHSSRRNRAVEQYARAAVQDFQKYFNGVTDCHIILDHQKNDYVHNKVAEITAHVHHHTFVAREAAESYQKAIDSCVDHICRQLQKHKEKVRHL
ncbi:MAG: ribosome-associated translation inhibitor RaiA [Chloroherpetonaceae bacterium]|nr:ribosome-associated translation inhibitor RaiA [Chloroherpetonaceae bacterium]MCS7211334.1 ribosome-associated translation inhibitor RaiA [Chloroherpetonaceae bacterium]MDW8020382.1 ribosome-associated translation inhibitor RaiA [Chloroherpetonaceae bacterium]MDW8465901.1 ribosome-associated translation inhibitor RaiA [Chloroherpetonaceae bacterium]